MCEAYGWPANLTDEEILERLVALNAERAAEEARGLVRWLRPEFQQQHGTAPRQGALELVEEPEAAAPATTKPGKAAKAAKLAWPPTQAERTRAIQQALAASTSPVTPQELAGRFQR